MLLLIDNFDSFTHNLARYFRELDCDIEVVRNNALSINDIEQLAPQAIVISPGPCTPNEAGISLQVISHFTGKIPILGVCLGHQSIGQVFGAKVVGAHTILHGKTSPIHHNGSALFRELPKRFNVTRYHSLVLSADNFPECLEVTAWHDGDDGYREIMAIAHREYPLWGVQFHPESLLTEHGHKVLANFLAASHITPQ